MRNLIIPAICLGLGLSAPAQADEPQPFPDFTFKRAKPPKAGTKKLITVQITPDSQTKSAPVTQALPKVPAATARYGWFWDKVPAGQAEDGRARLRRAMRALAEAPGGDSVAGPRLQTLQEIARAEGANILLATIGTEVSPALVLAVIAVESAGQADAVSGAGAQGLMQLMPDTAERFGVSDSLAADQNVRGGVAYLDWLLKEFQGDAVLALAGYNAGENAVKQYEGVPPFAETRDYVPKVLAAFEVAKGLCQTRPQLVSDGCAFNLSQN